MMYLESRITIMLRSYRIYKDLRIFFGNYGIGSKFFGQKWNVLIDRENYKGKFINQKNFLLII